jgi:hypothetical protein
MTTQYTPTLKLALPVTGELSGTWGDVVNDNITSMIEQAIAGLSTINTWTGNAHTLTTANGTTSESRCAMLVAATGAGGSALTGAGEIICPASAKLYVVQNTTAFAITLKTSAGTGVAVAASNTAFLFCNGTSVNSCVTTIVDGNITGNLTVGGDATINGNTTLGNATSDTITATARFNTDLLPSTDNARDLGSAANSWRALFIDGTATMALVAISGGTINGVSIGATTPATFLAVDNLSLDGNTIASTNTNGNVVIAPNGTGDVQLDADTVRVGDAAAAATLTSNGAGALTVTTGGAANLTLSTNSGTNSGTVQIAQGVNGNITLTPNGTGSVSVPKLVVSTATATRVPYISTGGLIVDSANLTFSGTDLTVSGAVNAGSVNATTLDLTNLEVTNIKAKDGTASITLADSTGVATINAAPVMTALTASQAVFTTAGKALVSNPITGTGDVVMSTSPTLVTPALGTPSSVTLTNATGLPVSTGISGLGTGVATALAVNVGTAGSPVVNGGALGTPSSGTVTNLTGTASININGTVGATTPATGAFTTLSSTGNTTLGDAAADTVTINGTVQPGVVISGSSTGDALRITQTGTGNALLVEDAANPDSTPVVVDPAGRVVVGYTAAVATYQHPQSAVVVTPSTQIQGVTAGSSLAVTAWSNVATTSFYAPAMFLAKSASATIGTQAAVVSGEILGTINFSGDDGTAFVKAAQITGQVDGAPGTNDMPGRLIFSTTADGSATPTERMRINSSGLTTVGFSAVTGAALSTTVAAKLYSASATYTDGITAASGTVAHGTIASFDNPAIAATNTTVTYTNASTVYIDGAPTAGTNVTITNPYALYVAAGTVYFGGTVSAADPIVQQSDIGTAPNEIPLNQYLGNLAYMNADAVVVQPQASATPNGVRDMVFQLTNDTTLVVKVKGSDGTVRSATLTLA